MDLIPNLHGTDMFQPLIFCRGVGIYSLIGAWGRMGRAWFFVQKQRLFCLFFCPIQRRWWDQNILGKEWLWGMALGWLGNGFWVICFFLPEFNFTTVVGIQVSSFSGWGWGWRLEVSRGTANSQRWKRRKMMNRETMENQGIVWEVWYGLTIEFTTACSRITAYVYIICRLFLQCGVVLFFE